MSGEVEGFRVSQRCSSEGYFGTIRFVGPVPPTTGEWVGVEWDDPTRGKHSGDHEGKQYFTCRQANAGSFVRSKKLTVGRDFISVLKERYSNDATTSDIASDDDTDIKVEIVGMEHLVKRQGCLEQLKEVHLRGLQVSSPGSSGDIRQTAPNIEILNLSCNPYLASWEDVTEIVTQLADLHILDLSENKQIQFHPTSKLKIQRLYLNMMELTWDKVKVILPDLPLLEELYLYNNRIGTLTNFDPSDLQHLTILNLENNGLSDWSEVMKLASLPQLKSLILSSNKLTNINITSFGDRGDSCIFPVLQSISLKGCNIETWGSVEELNAIQSLTELRITDNPVISKYTPFDARQLIIARLANLSSLNGSAITSSERFLAERFYLSKYAADWVSHSSDTTKLTFNREHPRYEHLIKVHGEPEEAKLASHKVTSLKDQLLEITLRIPDAADTQEVRKKLPSNMTLQKLKGLIQRLLKIDYPDQLLSYISSKGDTGCEYQLEDDLRELGFYSITSGDVILVRQK